MNDVNEAIGLVWDVIRTCDVDAENVSIDVYDRETSTDGDYMLGDSPSDSDAKSLNMPVDALSAIVSLDPDYDYSDVEGVTVDVELESLFFVTRHDPDRTLADVRRILDNDWMYDSANVRIYIYDQESGRDAYFDYGETIVDSDVMELYDWAEDEDGDEDRSKVVTVDGVVLVDYGDAEDALQRVVNLEGYELPGNMLVSVDLGRITVM